MESLETQICSSKIDPTNFYKDINMYFYKIREILEYTSDFYEKKIQMIIYILKQAKILNSNIFIYGNQYDYNLINHINTDFEKMNNLRVINMGIPAITAYGNDFPYPYQLRELLRCRNFSKKDIFIGIVYDNTNELIKEAIKFNSQNGGYNILFTNIEDDIKNVDITIRFETKSDLRLNDLTQILFHYISTNICYETNLHFIDKGAISLKNYCSFLINSIDKSEFYINNLPFITEQIVSAIINNKKIFAVGNGGSSALASYFIHGLNFIKNFFYSKSQLIDLTNNFSSIVQSINSDTYKKDVYTNYLNSFDISDEDIILGISSSGNSMNILNILINFPASKKFTILGFEDGGLIGNEFNEKGTFIFSDYGNYKSYQRSEDGQRIAISAILNSFYKSNTITSHSID